MLHKELVELDEALKKHVKVTDIPEEWKKEMNMLKVHVKNTKPIEKTWDAVETTWDKIDDSQPVRNLESSLKRWGKSDEVKELEKLDEEFKASPEGKKLVQEWKDVFKALDGAVYHNKKGIHIDNKKILEVEDELTDVGAEYEALEGSVWEKRSEEAWEAALNNKQAHSVKRRAKSFEHSAEGKALKHDLENFGKALHDNIEVTDVPEHWKKDMYLF